MGSSTGKGRNFLFLQGPHGPFFDRLARQLTKTGASVLRVGFNAGDGFFWRDKSSYLPFADQPENWPAHLQTLLQDHAITDLVLYGDTRPAHAQAVQAAHQAGLRVHVFEEGYLRPFWATYERDGSNGNSRLMQISIAQMRAALGPGRDQPAQAPDHWGDMREHIFYGALYHWFVLFANRRYRHFRTHRSLPVSREFWLYFKRLLLMPYHFGLRALATRRIKREAFPYHLVLLQLEHDASFQAHTSFTQMRAFLEPVIAGFAKGAPRHHHLVFKAHPLEDGRAPLRRDISRIARQHGLKGRVHFVRGGKLAGLLDGARSAVTANSTSAQQALWRGLPLKVLGRAVYAKPELVSEQSLPEFFRSPRPPDSESYGDYRRFLLATSQLPGGYYSARARRQLLRELPDLMLESRDPYEALLLSNAATGQQLRLVK